MSPDIHTLTGAYAADALPDDERRFFESHLAECDACAQEVAELQATTAILGAASYETPPPGMKAAVLAEIDQIRQEPPLTAAGGTAAGGRQSAAARALARWTTNLALPAAAVVVIAILGLSVVVANLNARLGEVETASTSLTEVLAAPDAQLVPAEGPDGSHAQIVVSESRGEAVFVASGLEPAPHEHTYELWLIDETGATPAGLFDVDERGRVTRIMTGDLAGTLAIGVTVEPAGGSPQPTTEPILVAELTG
jgi:anti-sigma-K factor RskA